jgi:uncharacterized membrane protein YciS (DUF1049 family)
MSSVIGFIVGFAAGLVVAFFIWKNNQLKITELTAKLKELSK